MPGYKPQVKSENGDMVDIPIAATYDENGNRITKYVSTMAQTFTEEEKAQARANIGAAGATGGGSIYTHTIFVGTARSGTWFSFNSTHSEEFQTFNDFAAWLDAHGFSHDTGTNANIYLSDFPIFFPTRMSPWVRRDQNLSDGVVGSNTVQGMTIWHRSGTSSGDYFLVPTVAPGEFGSDIKLDVITTRFADVEIFHDNVQVI